MFTKINGDEISRAPIYCSTSVLVGDLASTDSRSGGRDGRSGMPAIRTQRDPVVFEISVSRCRPAVWSVRRAGSVGSVPGLSGPANWLQVGGLRRRGAHAACATRGRALARAAGTGPTSSDFWAYRSRAAGRACYVRVGVGRIVPPPPLRQRASAR
jgi:hypothetical protein